MEWCSINGCYSYRLPRRVHLYRLFRGGKFREEWMKQILNLNGQRIDPRRTPLGFRVCDIHFEQEYQIPNIPGRLTTRAVPTIFPKMFYFIIKRNEYTSSTILDPDVIRSNILQVEIDIKKSATFCAVPLCNTLRWNKNETPVFQIPQDVMDNPALLQKWFRLLCVEPPFPKKICICSLHFRKDDILAPASTADQQKCPALSSNAIPMLNLPTPTPLKENVSKEELERAISFGRTRLPTEIEENNVKYDTTSSHHNGFTQENLNQVISLGSYFDLTGLNDKKSLDALVNHSLKLEEKMAMRKRIILTLCRLKTNRDFKQLATMFGIDYNTIANCFADTIKHLSGVFKSLVNWTSNYNKTLTAFDKITIKTNPELEILIGVAPSGIINYVSPMSTAGIEMVEPKILFEQHYLSVAHMKMRIGKLQDFKFISESVDETLVPFIDDIMIVLCGLVNNTLLSKNKT